MKIFTTYCQNHPESKSNLCLLNKYLSEASMVTNLLQQASQVNTKMAIASGKPTIKQIQPKPVVLNLSSASGNPTLKQILSQPYNGSNSLRNITSQTVNLTSIQNQKPQIIHYGQPLKLNTVSSQNFKIVNIQPNQTINEKCLPTGSTSLKFQNVKILNEVPGRKDQNTVIVVNNNTIHKNITPNLKTIAKKSTKHINKILNSSDVNTPITPTVTAPKVSSSNNENIPTTEEKVNII